MNRIDRIADLEIGIHRRDGQTYAVEMRLLPPGADEEVRPESGVMEIDLDALRAEAADDAYGEQLGAALLKDDKISKAFATARAAAASADVPLRVRLLIGPTASELHTLKWEAARDRANKTTLFTGESLLFSRYISSGDWRPLRPKAALRAFALISNPTDVTTVHRLAPVRVADELAGITDALGAAVQTVPAGGRATMSALLAALREGFDVLYLVAHGKLFKGEPKIYLENDDGSSNVVSGNDLVAKLSDLRLRPRLVVLGSCQSAGTADQPATEGYMAALGPSLAESGIPAVVAMQGMVSMRTEALFMTSFFKQLRRHGLADMAMSVARNEAQLAKRPDWWMPVLFMRQKSGRVWDPPDYGAYPNFVSYLEERGGLVDYSAEHFFGRQWLTQELNDKLAKLEGRGGIVVLEAPMGWGKTAVALHWVRASLRADPSTLVQFDGWVFARQGSNSGEGSDAAFPTGNLEIVLQQLESLTRHRLAMPREARGNAQSAPNGTSNFPNFLHDCGQLARNRSRPVLLLIDAVDEALGSSATDLAERLPAEWPHGVQLVITGRQQAVGEHRLKGSSGRAVLRLTITNSLTRTDLASYVAMRVEQIMRSHGMVVAPWLRDAILAAGQGSFVVVAGLLRERGDLLIDLGAWRDGTKALPIGLFEYWNQEIERTVRRIKALHLFASGGSAAGVDVDVSKMVIHLLGWMVRGRRDCKPPRFTRWLQVACTAPLSGELGRSTAEALHSLHEIAKTPGAVTKVLECMSDLFGRSSVDDKDSLLKFVHQGLRDHTLTLTEDHAPSLNGLWGVLCEHALLNQAEFDDTKLRRYAYLHAPRHLARAEALDPGAWRRGAQLMLDIRPGGDGYLDQLFQDPSLRDDAWESFTRNLSVLLRTIPNSQSHQVDRMQSSLPSQLRSLRHVLADQHLFITRGELPLVAALFNRQAGHWKESTPWGKKLRQCATALDRPWLRDVDPSPASALGPVTHVLNDGVTAMASTPDGFWLAVGLASGETLLWSVDALVSGYTGLLATRHEGQVLSVALLSCPGSGGVWLASGGRDGAVHFSRHDTLRTKMSRGSIDGSDVVNGGVAMQLQSAVTCVALVDVGSDSSWWLAAGTVDGCVNVVKSEQADLAVTSTSAEPLRLTSAVLALRHAGSVLDIAFLADPTQDSWWLASAGLDGTTQFVHGKEIAFGARSDSASGHILGPDLRGRNATRHTGPVWKLALFAGAEDSAWWLASAGDDGASRVVRISDGTVSTAQLFGVVATQHTKPVRHIVFGPAAEPARWRLASVGDDGSSRMITDLELTQMSCGAASGDTPQKGEVATQHEGDCTSVALLSSATEDRWLLASAGAQDGVVRVASSIEVGQRPSAYEATFHGYVVETIAANHSGRCITSVALLADVKGGGCWLVSADADGTVLVTRLGEGRTPLAGPGAQCFGRVATRHHERVMSLSLLAERNPGHWLLASGSMDGTTRISSSEDPTSGSPIELLGRIATCHGSHHRNQVLSVALAAGETPGDWWLASGAQDGSVRVARSHSTEPRQCVGVAGEGQPIGHLVSRHTENAEPITSLDLLGGTDRDHCIVAWTDAAGAVQVSRTDVADREALMAQHRIYTTSVAFLRNGIEPGRFLISASSNGEVCLIDSETSTQVGTDPFIAGSLPQFDVRDQTSIPLVVALPCENPDQWSFAYGDRAGNPVIVTGTKLKFRCPADEFPL